MIQFTDANLDAALAPGQVRTIRPLLSIDWLKNDTFVSPASQLTSDNLIQVDCVDDVDSGLPAEVNGRPTASSTTLTATLHGYVDDLPLWKLFSAWNRESPYHGLTLEGAAVKYETNTATTGGSTATRRFTGWVDSVQVDRVEGTVTVVAKNNLHLLGHPVSLPRWARSTNIFDGLSHVMGWDIPNEDRMENAPLTVAYLIQNVLRQCKALPGPDPRADSIWFSSGYAGLLPEKGLLTERGHTGAAMSQGISSYVFPQNWGFPNYNRDILSFGELGFPSPYASADQPSGLSGNIFDTYSQSAATVEVLPFAGQTTYINGGVWARIPSGDSGSFVDQTVFLDPWKSSGVESDLAKVRLVVGASNTTLTIRNTAAGNLRTLTVATPTTKDALIYVSWELDFSDPSTMRIWYDNVQQTGSLSGTLTTYPTVASGWIGTGRYPTKVRVWCRHAGFVNAEIWRTNVRQVGSTRIPTWANQSYIRKDFAFINGGLPGAQVIQSAFREFANDYASSGLMPCVTHIPVRQKVDAWELLKEICAAFHMSMWIDAYGGLRIITQGVLNLLEQRLADPRKELDGDSLQGISLTTDYDSTRDRVVYADKVCRTGWSQVIYEPASAYQFTADAGQTISYRVPFPDDAISVDSYLFLLTPRYFDEPLSEWHGSYNAGFKATQINGDSGTNIALWPVGVTTTPGGITDQYFDIQINNSHSQRIYLADSTRTSPGAGDIQSPAFKMPGKGKTFGEVVQYTQGFGDRLLQLPISEFHSAAWTMTKTIAALLYRASQNVPRAEDLTLPGDPRREVYDMINLHDPDGGLAVAISQIIGRADTWSSGDGYTQRLSVRLVYPPDSWLMEIDGFTEADQTTYFG